MLGKIYDYIDNLIIRQLVYKEHKIYYYIENEKTIHILSLVHHKQDTKSRLDYIKKFLS